MSSTDETIASLNRLNMRLKAIIARPETGKPERIALAATSERIERAVREAREHLAAGRIGKASSTLVRIGAETLSLSRSLSQETSP